uniref:Gamma-tubulin complex component n=1 Tax=Caenorhabditis japonica TaxID=281687 RepID=A0A8R1HWA2_CAEJA
MIYGPAMPDNEAMNGGRMAMTGDFQLSAAELKQDLENRLVDLNLESFRPVVNDVLEKLEALDDALHYFVLVSTFRLPDSKFAESLKELSVEQNLMFRLNGEYKYRLYSKSIEQNNVPRLAWDISPVLKTFKVADKDAEIPANNLSNIKPIDDWGLLSREFHSILRCEELRLCAQDGRPVDFFHLDSPTFYQKLLDMHRGISSDLFQVDSAEHFYQSKACRVEEWNLTTTRTILQKHVYLANQLGEVVHKLKRHFVAGSENSIRLIMQKYLIEEQQIFSEYFESLLGLILVSDGQGEGGELRFKSIIGHLPRLNLSGKNRFEVCDELYTIVSAYYHVLHEMNEILININNYSPILLNEMSFIGSQSAPQMYSRRMWRRLNVALIRFIVNKLAEMLTTSDAELMELLTDAGDAKLIKDPSIWQRLNPLQMESSQCIDSELANRVADLIIGYQFFVNDKKSTSLKMDGSTFAKSDIQDAEELELFSKTPEFERIIDGILDELDVNKMTDNRDELTNCIEKLLEKIPTTSLVDKYSQVVLEKSVRFFEFLKKFFTSAYIHLKDRSILSRTSLDTIKREKMHKKEYDAEFLKTVGYDMKSTMEDCLLIVSPPEPLNVFVSSGVTGIYSQVFTILNMLHTALDAVIETHNSETLTHEPRLRYAFFHMNTTVFAIRKNMLTLIEAAYETLMSTVNFKKSPEKKSAHEWLDVAYRAHRRFVRDMAGALMLHLKRGTTGRVIQLMVGSVSQASKSCVSGDAVGAERYYQQFQSNLLIFLDQCRLDHVRYVLYRSLEIGGDETDGRRSLHSSYSDDLSCRSY